MSEFVDPIKNVKKKVKFLDEASSIIKSSLRQQLDRQREIKGLEVAKTEEYAKQAKPIVEAIGTLPSEEEKKLGKENDRSIVIQDMIDVGIPSYDPSYNIILKLFDDSYDTIKSRKTDSLKQKGIDMMVSSVDSLLTDNDYFPIPTPIGQLSKNIFEKVFLNKDYTLSDMLKNNVKLHEEMIVDREQTEAERTQVEAEKKVEEEKKAIEAQAEKVKAEKSEEELRRIEEENKVNQNVKDLMYQIYVSRLREQGMNIEKSPFKSQLKNAFDFIHPFIITETDENAKVSKINDLINSPVLKKKVSSQQVRNNIKRSLIRTYSNSVISSTTSKTEKDGLLDDIRKIIPKSEPIPETKSETKSEPIPETKSESVPETTPTPSLLPETKEEDSYVRRRYPDLIEGNSTFERLDNYKTRNSRSYATIYNTDKGNFSTRTALIFSNIDKFYTTDILTPIDKLEGQIDAITNYSGTYKLIKKESLPEDIDRKLSDQKAKLKKKIEKLINEDVMYPSNLNPAMKGYGLKKGKTQRGAEPKTQRGAEPKKQKGGFNFLNMFAPIPLVGNGMTILNPKNFQKGMKKKANEDLLHNLQVHMAQVQAGNNNLKEPIKMLVNEAMGRGIMKKQVGNKIIKNFS